jgi:hypothetical protein
MVRSLEALATTMFPVPPYRAGPVGERRTGIFLQSENLHVHAASRLAREPGLQPGPRRTFPFP